MRKKVVFIGVMIIGSLMAIRTMSTIWRLYKAGEQVKSTETSLREAKSKNDELRTKLDEVQTPEYIEQEVRDKLGYAKSGEEVVIVPKQEEAKSKIQDSKPVEKSNWRKWWDLYIRL